MRLLHLTVSPVRHHQIQPGFHGTHEFSCHINCFSCLLLWNDVFHIVCKQAIVLNFGKKSANMPVNQPGADDMMMELIIQAAMGFGFKGALISIPSPLTLR